MTRERQRERETDFVGTLIPHIVTNHCSSDGLGNFHDTVQNKRNYLKILEFEVEKFVFKSEL
jgi:hypothetical protein